MKHLICGHIEPYGDKYRVFSSRGAMIITGTKRTCTRRLHSMNHSISTERHKWLTRSIGVDPDIVAARTSKLMLEKGSKFDKLFAELQHNTKTVQDSIRKAIQAGAAKLSA